MLPIIPTSSADIYRMFLKADAEFARSLGEEFQLDFATAIVNSEIPQANQVRDVSFVPNLIQQVDQFFESHNTRCDCYITQDAQVVAQLLAAGYQREISEVHLLREYRPAALTSSDDLKIIPARASYRHAEQILGPDRLLHLDDPHLECLLALRGQSALASAAVLTVGETGYITLVLGDDDQLKRTLIDHLLDLCSRAQLRYVFTNITAQPLYQSLGFRKVCDHTIYRAPR